MTLRSRAELPSQTPLNHPGGLLGFGTYFGYDAPDQGPYANFQLYNLRQDPGEKRNLAKEDPAKVVELLEKLKANLEAGRSRGRSESVQRLMKR